MQTLPAIFGAACLFVALTVTDRTARLIAVVFIAAWAVSNLFWGWDALRFNPLLDLTIGALLVPAWRTDRSSVWKQRVFVLWVCQMAFHVVYRVYGVVIEHAYLIALNVTFAMQIAIVWLGGGGVDGTVRFFAGSFRRLRRVLFFGPPEA